MIIGLWQPHVDIDIAFWSFDAGSSDDSDAKVSKCPIIHPANGNMWRPEKSSSERILPPPAGVRPHPIKGWGPGRLLDSDKFGGFFFQDSENRMSSELKVRRRLCGLKT